MNRPIAAPSPAATDFDQDLLDQGHVAVHCAGSVANISLNRPAALNAQLPTTWEALAHIGSRLPEDIRVVIVCGEGSSFSAGLDRSAFSAAPGSLLGTLAGAPESVADEAIAGYQRGFSWLSDPRFISIAAVAGHAIGAGFQLALACDLIVAADDAQFRMAEVSLGLVPDLGGTGRLIRLVGYQRALEICATGRHVHADEAVRIGLALVSVPVAELDSAVADLAAAVVESPAPAVRAVKQLIALAHDNTAADQLAAERAAQIPLIVALARAAR
ncbi:MAG: enoyl-CoA hydratase/isomerase family protein [Nakamurella sp.]